MLVSNRHNHREECTASEHDLLCLDGRIARDHTKTGARSIDQHSVEPSGDLGEVSSIVVGNDRILDTHTQDVTDDGLGTILVRVVGPKDTGIFHQRS